MSRLRDAIAAEPSKTTPGPDCAIAKVRARLDGEDLVDFEALHDEVKAGDRSAASLSRILARVDIRVKADRITYHMRGDCRCQGADQ